jgi:PadR family transcriptional regulator, regulatory protein PadR
MHYYYSCSFRVKNFLGKLQRLVDMRPSKHHNVVLIMLGEFEYLILSAAVRLQENAYGAAIRQEIETASKRRCSIGALYTTLDRLENKGLIKTAMGDPTPQRGGRPKRMVRLTSKGVQAATEFYATVTRVSRGVSWAVPGRNES